MLSSNLLCPGKSNFLKDIEGAICSAEKLFTFHQIFRLFGYPCFNCFHGGINTPFNISVLFMTTFNSEFPAIFRGKEIKNIPVMFASIVIIENNNFLTSSGR